MQHAVARIESFPIAGGFRISREVKQDAVVVSVTLTRGAHSGMGECYPLKRYGDTAESVKSAIENWVATHDDWTRAALLRDMRAGPARCALDAAMWRLEAAERGLSMAAYVAMQYPDAVAADCPALPTAFTLGGDTPHAMAEKALAHRHHKWLKVKLMGDGQDAARLTAIHAAVPDVPLIVDANEALDEKTLAELIPFFMDAGVCLIEQPLPAGQDSILKIMQLPIPLAADESCHTADDLDHLVGKYEVANIKLDKCGGLTHGMAMAARARALGLDVMVGCMVSTGLGILPACFLAQQARFIDLDGALLLEKDRENSGICYSSGHISLIK